MTVLRRNVWLRRHVRRARSRLFRFRFRWHARGGVDENLIVFESFVGRAYAASPRALYEVMITDERFASFRFVWALRDPELAPELTRDGQPRTEVVRFGSAAYYRVFGQARVWISNSILLPELVPRRQLYVQTWHGTGIKRIGFDVVASTQSGINDISELTDRYRIEAPKIGLFVSPAPFGTKVFASAFRLPPSGRGSPFVETGNPRNDRLVNPTATQLAGARARLGIPAGGRTILYAPTFRDDQFDPRTGYLPDVSMDLQALRAALGPDDLLLVRMHYLVAASARARGDLDGVRDLSAAQDVNDVLLASDVLVTDYSSLAFDFNLLDRAMVFYLYDTDHYERDLRGFYFPVDALPGTLVHTQDELVTVLLDPQLAGRDAERRRVVRECMCPHDDGHASRRVLDAIVERLIADGRAG